MTASSPRTRKGELTRARLLGAARAVFEESGFLEARIADIAAQAGMSYGSFYHYFDTKEQIFRELAALVQDGLSGPADEVGEPATTEYERIRRANRRYLERYRDNARFLGVIEEVSRYDDVVGKIRAEGAMRFIDRADRRIKLLQKQGLADKRLNSRIAAVALGGLMSRFAEMWLVEHLADYRFEVAVEQLTLLWTGAIGLTEPAAPPARTVRPARRTR